MNVSDFFIFSAKKKLGSVITLLINYYLTYLKTFNIYLNRNKISLNSCTLVKEIGAIKSEFIKLPLLQNNLVCIKCIENNYFLKIIIHDAN